MRIRKTVAVVATMCVLAVPLVAAPPATAHTGPELRICEGTTDCTTAVFAICNVQFLPACKAAAPSDPAKGPRAVTIRVHFSANKDVHIWWMKGPEPAHPSRSDCKRAASDAVLDTRYHLADVTTDNSGHASYSVSLPPGNLGSEWLYGPNWVCATTAAHGGGSGEIADRLFTIYPI